MAALADPEQFFKGLTKLGVSLKEQRSFPDHYADFEKEVFKELSGGKSVVMTEKDAAKVSTKSYNKGQIFVVSFEAKASSEKDDAVINRVVSQL